MKNKTNCRRIGISPGDVAQITGLHIRSAQRLLHNIRTIAGKSKKHIVTIAEFCSYAGFLEQDVFDMLNNL